MADIIFICTFLFYVRKTDTQISIATMTTQKEGGLPVLWFLVAQYDTHLSSGKGGFLIFDCPVLPSRRGGGEIKISDRVLYILKSPSLSRPSPVTNSFNKKSF